ncbi:DUF455 family protein [Horticoccus luteus]|uniref:DUF455 family protein n=1 Tax=Horticoccus luteus TaxID=2862869 RepID=A0A8F9TUW1_9BACT|nr:DUF455 family protein [Horticoccus luteus]QYM78560.1 DUF455 family protein [Horticoccus luteus]
MATVLAPALDRPTLMVTPSARILKRFYFIERELIRQQAGWLPAVTHWETKLLLPELMWENSLLARALRERVLELRYPERRLTIDEEGAVLSFFQRLANAPSAEAFVLALGRAVRPLLRRAYQDYLSVSDHLDDGPTQFLLRHGLTDLDHQISRLEQVSGAALAAASPAVVDDAAAWCRAVSAALAEALSPPLWADAAEDAAFAAPQLAALERPFQISRTGGRDARFDRVAFAWPDRHTPAPAGEGLRLRARQAIHHVNEVWAAEMAAACLYDFAPTAPHEFIEDAARWCYDEIRHCRMGYERLKRWGFTDSEIPLDSFSYDAGADLAPIVRLGIIFYFEATFIHTKKERTVLFSELGDQLSSHDMDFDWADELIHTHYGKKWLEKFLATTAGDETLSSLKATAREAVFQRLARATPEDKAATAQVAERAMAKMAKSAALN